jgi:hypothetical protein
MAIAGADHLAEIIDLDKEHAVEALAECLRNGGFTGARWSGQENDLVHSISRIRRKGYSMS